MQEADPPRTTLHATMRAGLHVHGSGRDSSCGAMHNLQVVHSTRRCAAGGKAAPLGPGPRRAASSMLRKSAWCRAPPAWARKPPSRPLTPLSPWSTAAAVGTSCAPLTSFLPTRYDRCKGPVPCTHMSLFLHVMSERTPHESIVVHASCGILPSFMGVAVRGGRKGMGRTCWKSRSDSSSDASPSDDGKEDSGSDM